MNNVSQQCNLFPEEAFGGSFTLPGKSPQYETGPRGRTQKVKARVCKTGGGEPAKKTNVWDVIWNEGLPDGHRRVDRCHLLGNQLGGSVSFEYPSENVVPCCAKENNAMSKVENKVAAFVNKNCCVDFLVEVTYYRGSDVPHFMKFTAVGKNASTNQCEHFSYTVTNPEDLCKCPVF